jgi:hypothetical protein
MTKKIQLGFLTATIACLSLAGVAAAQSHPDRPPQRQQQAPAPRANNSRPPAQNPNAYRPPQAQNQSRPSATKIAPARPNNLPPNNRPYNYNNRPNTPYQPNGGARMSPRQQIGVGSPRPFVDQMRELTPQQRDRVLQNSRTFQNLAPEQQNRIRNQFNQWDRMNPSQRADLRAKEQTWRNLTPEQRDRIKNDVLPQWRQIPWQRQQVIQQKLGVLQNMPEFARNQRLADPNFTRGMDDSDKAMLHDLAHMHVGGAPEPPGNEP